MRFTLPNASSPRDKCSFHLLKMPLLLCIGYKWVEFDGSIIYMPWGKGWALARRKMNRELSQSFSLENSPEIGKIAHDRSGPHQEAFWFPMVNLRSIFALCRYTSFYVIFYITLSFRSVKKEISYHFVGARGYWLRSLKDHTTVQGFDPCPVLTFFDKNTIRSTYNNKNMGQFQYPFEYLPFG